MDCVYVFKALSNVARIRIFHLLIEAKKELCICEIMSALLMTQYNVSKHIKELKIAELVKERRESRFVFYSFISADTKLKAYIVKAISSISDDIFDEDNKKLKKRLTLRKNNRPVICTKKCKR